MNGVRSLVQRSKPRERGQAMIETAFCLTLFFLVLLGAIGFMPALINMQNVKAAARQGAHAGAVQSRMDQACAAAISYAQAELASAGILRGSTITVSTTGPQNDPYQRGATIIVTVKATIASFFGKQWTVQTQAQEEIVPGRSRWPVRSGQGSPCQASA